MKELEPGIPSLHRQRRRLREVFRQVTVFHHRLAFAPGDDVDRVNSGWQPKLIPDGGILAVSLADVLLILVNELHVLAISALLNKRRCR